MTMHASMIYGLVALLLVKNCLWCTEATVHSTTQQLEVQQILKRLNKPAVKSIKSPDGDIIDCVHISNQPAFDHPLLKNHTIQMRPSSYPSGLYDEKEAASTRPLRQLWHKNGRCPKDTIPIRRTKKEDVLRASSVMGYGKSTGTIPRLASVEPNDNNGRNEHAVLHVKGGPFFGAKARLNVWNPIVETRSEFSAGQVLVAGGSGPALNSAQSGWHVFPQLYNDNRTRLFTYWTNDDYRKTGCYNLFCPGLVQTDSKVAVGAVLKPVSNFGGDQHEMTLLLWKDPVTENWWLQFQDNAPFGYWPATLFPALAQGASEVQWGGQVFNSNPGGHHTSTGMGSGHFPEEGMGKASYGSYIQTVDKSNRLRNPQVLDQIATLPDCYSVGDYNKDYFFFGGRGRTAICP